MIKNRLMVNHSTLCRSIKYDYMNILTWTILKKTQILNGCETFAFKYIFNQLRRFVRTPNDQDPPFLQEDHDSNEESKHTKIKPL